MLKSIRQYEKAEREGILSNIALELGRPAVDGVNTLAYLTSEAEIEKQAISFVDILHRAWTDPNDVRRQTVEEILRQLRLDYSVSPGTVRARVLQYLGREIRALALESSGISEARKRLGQKGMLSPSSYRISYAKEFHGNCEQLGITKHEVIQAIRYPDMMEHYMAHNPEREEAISLYAKAFANEKDPYSLLVDSFRIGDQLTVHYAFRVYHNDIDVSDVTRPTELLKLFTDRFGMEVAVGDRQGKLILNEKITNQKFSITFPIERGTRSLTRFSHRNTDEGTNEVSVAYSVNVDLYSQYLREHKVRQNA